MGGELTEQCFSAEGPIYRVHPARHATGGKHQTGPIASFHVSFQGNVHVLPEFAWFANRAG